MEFLAGIIFLCVLLFGMGGIMLIFDFIDNRSKYRVLWKDMKRALNKFFN